MKLTKWTILIPALLTSIHAHAQDTTSIYFEFASSKIPDSQLEALNSIPTKYNLADLDSVHFIGMADSVGDLKSNFKLSEKRANHIAKYCERLIPDNITYKITFLGERTDRDRSKSRRVDIIFYFQPAQSEEPEQKEAFKTKDACFNIDYFLLHRCHVRTITKRNTEFVVIETTLPDLKKKSEHYYGSRTKNGDFVTIKIKWSSKKTGNLWWSETRYVATIPKKDFDTYKIFTIKIPPCDSCSENFQNAPKISNEDTCIQLDRFLMENIQFKSILFNKRWVKIRSPREYVYLDDRYYIGYYIGCGLDYQLSWETKKGKKHQNYYYSKLPVYFDRIANIIRVMDCCKFNAEPSECDSAIIFCRYLGEIDRSFILIAELGSHYQQNKISPYAGLGISKAGYFSEVRFLAGTDIDLSFYSSFRYQYNFLSFPFSFLNPASTWQKPTSQRLIHRYGRLYFGSELKARINKTRQDHLEQNVHIGISAINTNSNAFITRIFLQYGLGIDYLGNTSPRIYSIFQLGMDMKILRLKIE
ncbi:MAG TPA: hypothetical protein VE978_03810 [Chitinophagales bacterium]|nr:hypothetical protein [Chitinophagales bacterium]